MQSIWIKILCCILKKKKNREINNKCYLGYDLKRLPIDLKPVTELIGLWQLESKSGATRDFSPPDLIDFAINPIPKFGARSVNITYVFESFIFTFEFKMIA